MLLVQSLSKDDSRIVIVSSWTHDPAHLLNAHVVSPEHKTIFRGSLEPLLRPAEDKEDDEYNAGMRRYGASKTILITIMYELQRRLSDSRDLKNISVLAVDPGGMPGTALIRDSSALLNFMVHTVVGAITPLLTYLFPNGYFGTPQKSAGDVLKACFDRQTYGEHPKGLYLNGHAIIQSSPETRDEEKQRALWAQTVEILCLKKDETILQIK